MASTSKVVLIHNIREALNHFISQYLKEAIVIRSISGDHGTFCYVVVGKGKRYYLTFNRSWFYKFSDIYKHVAEKGIGQSFKMSMLQEAADYDQVTIATVMENGYLYMVDAASAYKYVIDNHTFRIPSTETVEEGSIPAKMLKRQLTEIE